jgi:integrase
MYRRGKALYYVGADGRWIPLGSDLARAKRRWADFECVVEQRTVAELCERYIADKMGARAPSTVKQYRAAARAIAAEWPGLPCDQLRAPAIARYRDRRGVGRVWANTVISMLRVAYDVGIEWGWCELNPADAVAFNTTGSRSRYLNDAEFRAIRAAAPAWLALAMDLSYLTALRPSDLLALRWTQVGERVTVLPQKTRRTRTSISFEITPELRAVLESARRRPIVGLFVVATEKGRPITLRRLQERWRALVDRLGIEDCQFRDIRAKSATDADAQGQDPQALLHHTSARTTRRYLKLGQVKKAEPLRRKI